MDENKQKITNTFESHTIESMRERASNLTQCPAIDEYYSDATTVQPNDGWMIYPCDPTMIMSAFPHLTFHPDKKISGYYFREGIGGNAILSVFDKDEEITIPENISNYSIFFDLPPGDRDYQAFISFAEKEALRDAYSRVEMILELLPDPTFVIDKNGVILFWNRAMELSLIHI